MITLEVSFQLCSLWKHAKGELLFYYLMKEVQDRGSCERTEDTYVATDVLSFNFFSSIGINGMVAKFVCFALLSI